MSGAPRSAALLGPLTQFGMRLGLERVRRLLDELGAPQSELPVVLVAGTNGKGSTAALLAAMGRAAGYRTGLYTSPHLEAVTERLRVDGRAIDDRELAVHLEEILGRAAAIGEPPTYFEALTVAALRHFRRAGVEIAVLEVGLGGRLDATNVSRPILSLVTSIALDHERHLGTTVAAVAGEKAGILRPGVPAIAWSEDPEVTAVLRRRERDLGSELTLAPRRVRITARGSAADLPQRARLETAGGTYDLELHLAGRHQLSNLALAVLAAEALAAAGWHRLDAAAIARGARRCRWPGRLERVERPTGRRVILDAAHNPAAAAVLADWVRRLPEPPDLLFGTLADKAVASMLPVLASASRHLFLTRPAVDQAGGRGAADPREWMPLVAGRGDGRRVVIEPDPGRALDLALAAGGRELLACGSLYLVGELRRLLRRRFGVPPPPAVEGSGP